MRNFRWALALTIGLANFSFVRAATNVFDFSYTNRSALLADGWDFFARSGVGQIRDTESNAGTIPPDISYDQGSHPGLLRIAVGDGDLWLNSNNTVNSLLRNLSSNWVSLQLNLNFAPTRNYQQAHLALYQDDDNYIEIGHGYNSSVGGEGVLLVFENHGLPRIINRVGVVNSTVYLRLERNVTNDFVRGLYSHDGSNWVVVGEVSQEFVNPRLCVWAGGTESGPLATCDLIELLVETSDVPLPPILVNEPQHLMFSGIAGEACTNSQDLRVVARRAQGLLDWSLTGLPSWLSASDAAGITPQQIAVSVNTAGLNPGVYTADLITSGTNVLAGTTKVTLVLNPPTRVRASTWRGGSKGAMSVSVDDSRISGFEKLKANNLKGSYLLWGLTEYAPFATFYAAGMELGAHTVNHFCFAVDEPTRRFELETNVAAIVAQTGVPLNEVISFAWPCGFTTIKDQVIAAEYFLSARGYNFNELEDAQPRNWMNLKNFNSHENDPHEFNPGAPGNPPDLKPIADAAEAAGKWFNLVLHTFTNDDDAIPYSHQKDLWVAPLGAVVKYMKLRDRTIITNYAETATNLSFALTRLPLDMTRLRNFEAALGPSDRVTIEVDVTGMPSVGALSLGGSNCVYRVRDRDAQRLLLFETTISTNTLIPAGLVIGDGTPVALEQRITLAEDTVTNLVLAGTGLAGNPLSFEIISGPTNGVLAGSAPTISYSPATNFAGVDFFQFRVIDTVTSLTATGSVRLAVSALNDLPLVINVLTNQAGVYGTPFALWATNVFADPDGDVLTYVGTGFPPGLAVNGAGLISGIPSGAGTFAARLLARDTGLPFVWVTNAFEFVINKSNAPVQLGGLSQFYNGQPRNVSTVTEPSGLAVHLTYDGSPQAPVAVGDYQVIGVIMETNYCGGATNTLSVIEVPLLITDMQIMDKTNAALTWQAVPGFTYQIQYKDQLDSGGWQVMIPAVTATNGLVTVTNSVGSESARYYRVLLLP